MVARAVSEEQDESPCQGCPYVRRCTELREACGRFLQWLDSGENNEFPVLDKPARERQKKGKSLPPWATTFWQRPSRSVYYKIYPDEKESDVVAMFARGMTSADIHRETGMSLSSLKARKKGYREKAAKAAAKQGSADEQTPPHSG